MAIDPRRFLDAAREISNRDEVSHRETRARVAAGRAYYSAFLAVREVVRAAYGEPTHDPYHKDLSETLKGAPDSDVSLIGERLTNLRKLREKSDYYPDRTVSHVEAALILKDAEHVLDNIANVQAQIPSGIDSRP